MHKPTHHPTRRQVLAGLTAAAALGPMMLTGRSWAQATANEQMGVAWIGAGKRGRTIMQNYFLKDKRFRTIGIAEVDKTRRDYNATFVDRINKNNDCIRTTDYRELLEHKDVDVAVIATPDHWHTIPAMQAALAGKHVYCEKPLTLNIRESQLIIEAARHKNITFQTGSQQRTEFGGKFITACEYVRSGRLGKVEMVEVGTADPAVPCDLPAEEMEPGLDWERWLGPAPKRAYNSILSPRGVHKHFPKWRLYEEYAGGILADMGAHMYDIAQWGLDKDRESPVKVIPPKDPKDKRGVQLVYADGKRLVSVNRGHSVTFIGEKGKIFVDRGRISSEPASILQQPLTDQDVRLPRHANHGKNFADCIGTDQQPVCDVEVGSRSATLCHLANFGYDFKEELTFDPAKWRFKNNQTANARLDYAQRRKGYELPDVPGVS